MTEFDERIAAELRVMADKVSAILPNLDDATRRQVERTWVTINNSVRQPRQSSRHVLDALAELRTRIDRLTHRHE